MTTSGASTTTNINVEFTSVAKYSLWVWMILAIGPLACIVSAIAVALDGSSTQADRNTGLIVLSCTTLFIFVLYLVVLPKKYNVYSNNTSVGVVTLSGVTYKFQHVVRAYESTTPVEGWMRPAIKFATNFESRVVIRRSSGKWDVIVSPQDAQGFVNAVNRVSTATQSEPGNHVPGEEQQMRTSDSGLL